MTICPKCTVGVLRAVGLLLHCDNPRCKRRFWWHYPTRLIHECED